MSDSICAMPGTDVSPHCGPSDMSRKFFWRYGARAELANALTHVGDWPSHVGAKLRPAAAARIGAVSDGRATSTVISQPALWSWLIWAVKSELPALNVAFELTVKPSLSAA